jgi:hypothetical protein
MGQVEGLGLMSPASAFLCSYGRAGVSRRGGTAAWALAQSWSNQCWVGVYLRVLWGGINMVM